MQADAYSALLMSAAMMLNYLAETKHEPQFAECAARIRDTYAAALQAGETTKDLGGDLGTAEFADALIRRMGQG